MFQNVGHHPGDGRQATGDVPAFGGADYEKQEPASKFLWFLIFLFAFWFTDHTEVPAHPVRQ